MSVAATVPARLSAAARRVFHALPPAVQRRRPLAVVVVAALAGALAGALAPVGGSPENASAATGGAEGVLPGAALLQKPDLTPFLTNRRWGYSLLEERRQREEREAAERAAAKEPEPKDLTPLQAIGFVGIALNTEERAVLLTLADGEVVRRVAGEALADGRVLAAVREDALVLEGANGQRETLLLFPLPPAPASE